MHAVLHERRSARSSFGAHPDHRRLAQYVGIVPPPFDAEPSRQRVRFNHDSSDMGSYIPFRGYGWPLTRV